MVYHQPMRDEFNHTALAACLQAGKFAEAAESLRECADLESRVELLGRFRDAGHDWRLTDGDEMARSFLDYLVDRRDEDLLEAVGRAMPDVFRSANSLILHQTWRRNRDMLDIMFRSVPGLEADFENQRALETFIIQTERDERASKGETGAGPLEQYSWLTLKR